MREAICEDTDRLDLTLEKGNVEENGGKKHKKEMAKGKVAQKKGWRMR